MQNRPKRSLIMRKQLQTHFTPKQVAVALDVSESSVKRWCDSGLISTIRTVGGHRRITHAGLEQFLAASNRNCVIPLTNQLGSLKESDANKAPQTPTISDDVVSSVSNKFMTAVIEGNEDDCRAIFHAWLNSDSLASFADLILCPVFEEIGDRWSCEQIDVYQERRGCEIVVRLIQEFRNTIRKPSLDAPLAIGGSPSNDPYTLPGQLIESVLLEVGWRAINLGTNIPLESLGNAIRVERPRLFWLSVSNMQDPASFVEQYQEFSKSISNDVAVVVGGRALNDRIRPKLKFAAHCDNLRQLSDFAAALRGVRRVFGSSSN
jgi:MerR family transcriptional regulator, light-induced transcriptional regulator